MKNIISIAENTLHIDFKNRPHYLFGYGSLINEQSRLRTFSSKNDAIPIIVKGFQRSWSYKCSKREYTAVSVSRAGPEIETNGVLIPLDNPLDDLMVLDNREFHYARGLVAMENVRLLHSPPSYLKQHGIETDALIWVYENRTPLHENYNNNSQSLDAPYSHRPCRKFPIPQSYVDCILSGCLSYGEEFARYFVKSTHGWTIDAFLNDRLSTNEYRKYTSRKDLGEREGLFCKKTIDSLLSEVFNRSLSRSYSTSRL